MGLFSKTPKIDPLELDELRHELAVVRARLDSSERARAELGAQLQQLDAATAGLSARSQVLDEVATKLAEVDVLKQQMAAIDTDASNAKVSFDGLGGTLAELIDRVTASSHEAQQAREQTAVLNERVSNVSTELANQLSELGREMDGLAAVRPAANESVAAEQPVSIEMVDQLQTAQVRLADEQVRYEIAFRADLATLADQIKRFRNER